MDVEGERRGNAPSHESVRACHSSHDRVVLTMRSCSEYCRGRLYASIARVEAEIGRNGCATRTNSM
jgi:hypothetical protein